MKKRIVIIGLDGVPFNLIKDLSERGITPNLKALTEKFNFCRISSTVPEISSVAWSSIVTGKNPAEHGIFGFMDLQPSSYKVFFPNFTDLKTNPFWKDREDLYYQIINVPSTYPARPLNGILVSGFISYDMNEAVYPKSLLNHLNDMNYRVDVDSEKAHISLDSFIRDLDETLDAHEKFFNYAWDSRKDVFMFVFTETDRLFHFLWKAYEDKKDKYHDYFLDFFSRIDGIFGKKILEASESDSLIILSDHGFERLGQEVYINSFLKEKGFLQRDCRFENMKLSMDSSTKAFSLDPARIYINSNDRFPGANLLEDEKDVAIKELERIFLSWKIKGKNVISRVYRGDEIYDGPFKKLCSDLVLVSEKGFNLRSTFKKDELCSDETLFTGKHVQEGAFIITNCEIDMQSHFSVIDAGRLIKKEIMNL